MPKQVNKLEDEVKETQGEERNYKSASSGGMGMCNPTGEQ